jgi:hypothetical protein
MCIIALGLTSRKYPPMLPAGLEKYPGDSLWALMFFAGYCTLLPASKTLKVAVLALGTSYCVEFSQLYQAPWINAIRATTPGYLILGSTFHGPDLVAHTIGVVIGATLDGLWLRICRSRNVRLVARSPA